MITTTDLQLLEDKARYGGEWERFERGLPEHDPTDVAQGNRRVMRCKVHMYRKQDGYTIAQWAWERWVG